MKLNLPFVTIIILMIDLASVYGQVNLQTSNLPIVIINTNGQTIVDEPRISADMGIIWNGDANINNINDAFNDYDGKIAIELRGQSSQQIYDKKSYRLETQDNTGNDINVNLMGFPKENDWILYGPYGDKSLIRTALSMELGRSLGHYASRTKFCEVVIDGEYKGIYILMENIKRDNDRVDIAKLTDTDISGDEVTGGYILRLDKFAPTELGLWESDFSYSEGVRITYQLVYPKPEAAHPSQLGYIQEFMSNFENALRDRDYLDAETGYQKYIDVNSFIDYGLINELTRNPDAYRISTYMHKKKDSNGGKLHAGPIWDFNIGMGNADFCLGSATTGWVMNYNLTCPDDYWLVPYYWDRLLTDKEFTGNYINRWFELRQNELSNATIYQKIDSLAALLEEAQTRNFTQWPILDQYVWPNAYIGETYDAEIQYLKNWFTERTAWMDAQITNIAKQVDGEFSQAIINIYPNPVNDIINIDFQGELEQDLNFYIFNTLGQVVNKIELDVEAGFYYNIRIDSPAIRKLRQGIYYYTLVNSDGEIIYNGNFLKN